MNKIKAIDFFCGAGGMTYGMRKAGIDVIAGIDIDKTCKETYECNNINSKFIEADIKKYTFDELKIDTGISRNDDKLLFIGCSPCQYWSLIRTDKTKSGETKSLLTDFQNFVDYFRPGFIVIENVPGIMTKQHESGLDVFLKFLDGNNYKKDFRIINANDFGVPQTRKRFLLIASRVVKEICIPKYKTNKQAVVRNFIGTHNGFDKISSGFNDKSKFLHTTARLSQKNIKRLEKVPRNGGTRSAWKDDPELQINAYKNRDHSFSDVYGRMFWDKAAPTITTKFYSISNGRFGHPDETRALSIREGATLQTFPKKYVFKGNNLTANAKLIGNAVPPLLAKKIAKIFTLISK